MANRKISQLTALTTADSNDVFAIVDITVPETKKITLANLMASPGPIGGTAADTGEFTTLQLPAGATIDEFSTDTTLGGDSDTALPTEHAVKTYIDSALSSISADKISEGDSFVEVMDDGTSSAYVNFVVDSSQRMFLTDSQLLVNVASTLTTLTLAAGATIGEFSTDITLGGDSDLVVPTEHAVKTYVDNTISVISTSKISQGDSYIEVVDDATSSYLIFVVDNSQVGWMDDEGLKLALGTSVNEFSTDITLAGDSDDTVPTEHAVKTYVDNALSTITANKIQDGNSYVQVNDYTSDGTTSSYVEFVLDSTSRVMTLTDSSLSVEFDGTEYFSLTSISQILGSTTGTYVEINQTTSSPSLSLGEVEIVSFSSDGMTLQTGVTVNDISNDATFADDSTSSLVCEHAIKTYVDSINTISQGDSSIIVTDAGAGVIAFTADSTTQMTISDSGMALAYGVTVNDITNDPQLTSGSQTALVTEYAVKEYVENNSGYTDRIIAGDSHILVADDGTASDGNISFVLDDVSVANLTHDVQSIGQNTLAHILIDQTSNSIAVAEDEVLAFSISESGISLTYGVTANEISNDTTLASSSQSALVTEYAIKTYIDTEIAQIVNVRHISSNTSAVDGDVCLVDSTSGDVTITLTEASNAKITVKKVSDDANDVIVQGDSGTIDDAVSDTISTQYDAVTYVSDGDSFYII